MDAQSTRKRLSPAFIGQLHPCDHLLHLYGHDERLLEVLEWFVGQGLQGDAAVIVLATPGHLHDLEKRLRANWIPVDRARWQGRYIPLVASEVLEKFMVNGWPDEGLFTSVMNKYVAQAREGARPARAFGELVAMLMGRGQKAAAVRLEQMWTGFCNRESLPLLCAYPEPALTADAIESMRAIAAQHSRVLREEPAK
jgi:hypothetical protein